MKKRALSFCICLGITMALFAGCGSADQKKAVRENTEAVQETGTEALSRLMDNTEEATEVAEVTETTEASETSDPAASVDASATSAEASASGNDATTSGSTAAKADTNKSAAKSGSKSDSTSGSASQASQPAAASGSDNTTQVAAPAQTQQASSAQPASQPAAHEHQWEQYVKDTIDHPEVGHYETKVVQAAYDEPQYDWHYICNKCGLDMGTDDWNVINHGDVCDGSYRSDLVQVGTIHHDAVTEQVYVVDQAAWTEQVYGYRCSCGATK